jgi:hypothetical protein
VRKEEIIRLAAEVDMLKTANRVHLSANQAERDRLQAEIDRLHAAIKGAEIAITRDGDSDAAAQILIKAQALDPEALPDGTLSRSTMQRRAAVSGTAAPCTAAGADD